MSDKNERFKRLAKQRGDRILKDLRLLGNLSNKNNYSYNEREVALVISAIEEELKVTKVRFKQNTKREIRL